MELAVRSSQQGLKSGVEKILCEIETDPKSIIYCSDKVIDHLRSLRFERASGETQIKKIQELEELWRKIIRQSPRKYQITTLIKNSREAIEEVTSGSEKKQRKDLIHEIRNTLQNLYLSDSRETILHWETFLRLEHQISHPLLSTGSFRRIFNSSQEVINEWSRKYQEIMFVAQEDNNKAFMALKRKTPTKALSLLGNSIKKLLESITDELNDWEMTNKLI